MSAFGNAAKMPYISREEVAHGNHEYSPSRSH
jgi:hypothetical protein